MMMSPESAPAGNPGGLTTDERQWGMYAHLSALAGFVVPMGNILGPLIIWLVKRDQSAFVADQGKEALNFQITLIIAIFASLPLCFILVGFLFLIGLPIYGVVMEIVAGMKAGEGVPYRYPYTLRLIK